jgi:adenosylmethionine-8-amino-7-oxononanoate aminotransferase
VLLECVHVPPPSADAAESYARAFAALERVISEGHGEIAALVLEPILQGTGGMRSYDPEYLRRARALCDEHEVLLIVDEVFTGYGRTGPMWASDLAGITPDLLCLAKGFSGGMFPMAATLATRTVFDAFLGDPARAFYYGHSYCGNPLGAAVAREVLAIYRDEDILANAQIKAKRISAAFHALTEIPGVTRPRSIGMTGAIDLAAGADYLGRAGWRVYEEARKRGAYLRPLGDIVYIAPPLNIPDDDLEELLTIVRESVIAAME